MHESSSSSSWPGHVAIVEGKFSSRGINYVRIIEAMPSMGVVRSVLDDTRLSNESGSVYRVNGVSSMVTSKAVSFCTGQLGKSYWLDGSKNTSPNTSNWYCSELIWAAYKNQGIDLETSNSSIGVSPNEISVSSSAVYRVL